MVMVLSDGRIANRPNQAVVAASGRHGSSLYLLHATAWAPTPGTTIGRISIAYADGSSEEREVKSQREVADWWNPPDRLSHARLGWRGDNPHARIGLCVAGIPLTDNPLHSITFTATGHAVWLVCGLALGECMPLPVMPPVILREDDRWRPTMVPWEVQNGCALDLSALNSGPIPGRLIVRNTHFVLESEPAKKIRLLGANLCFSANFPERTVADRMAKALRQMGHNAVRIHHFDRGVTKRTGDGTELDPIPLDRLEYLIAACKREGLWLTADLYVSRQLPPGSIPELPNKMIGEEFKALIPLLPSAMENWKRFATNLLTHRNPHTGLTLAEDPALVTICLVNEDNLPSWTDVDPEVKALYDARFEAWIRLRPEFERTGRARDQARWRWLGDLQAQAYVTMRQHILSLGVRAPSTGANMQDDFWTTALRDGFDFIDNHSYHDHPSFPQQNWRLPFKFHQRSAVAELLYEPARLAHTRRLDRPFTVTEMNYCMPNHRRSEYAAGVAAVAGMQDWDGIWRFTFAHDINQITGDPPASSFDLARDPIALLGERALALLFRRGDVRAAPWSTALVYRPEEAVRWRNASPDRSFAALALHTRIGVLPATSLDNGLHPSDLRCIVTAEQTGIIESTAGIPVLPCNDRLPAALADAGLMNSADMDLVGRQIRSADGNVVCDGAAGRLAVVGHGGIAVVLPGGPTDPITVGGVQLVNRDRDPATMVIAALDSATLATTKHILILHLTDAQNSMQRFTDRSHTLVTDWGSSPMLIRAGAVGIRLPGQARMKAWALDLSGTRREELALVPDGHDQLLESSVVRSWGPCLAWEVARE